MVFTVAAIGEGRPDYTRAIEFAMVVAASDSTAKSKNNADYICDGVNDNVEIQAALDALPAIGGEVFLLEGTFNIEVSITLDSYQTLRGRGRNTILTTTTADLDIITATGSDGSEKVGILIADLAIDGDAGGVVNDSGIVWTYVDYSKIRNIWALNNGAYGIHLITCDFNEIIGNTCQDNGNDGLTINRSDNNVISGNTCQGNTHRGIYLYDSDSNTISGNTCSENTMDGGIYLYLSDSNAVSGNTCSENTYYGIHVRSSDNNAISGNTCSGNTLSGIHLWNSDSTAVSGNTCSGNGQHGIYVYGSSNNAISSNTCYGNSQTADDTYDNIFLSESAYNISSYNLIIGNVCRQGSQTNKPRYGINIADDACDRNCLVGNDLYDSGKTGDLNDVPTTNPTLKHSNRNLAGTGWLAEV